MIKNIESAFKKNLNEVDFVGANSPNRSDYKISFNANLYSYYSSSFQKNS